MSTVYSHITSDFCIATCLCEIYSFICIEVMELNPAKQCMFDSLLQLYSYALYDVSALI